ncbi:MAG: hypothetical protein QOH70_4012, partial [Blastocatellia bacterium]|nr:hypothetical protein [Blastocatellia bacterium]
MGFGSGRSRSRLARRNRRNGRFSAPGAPLADSLFHQLVKLQTVSDDYFNPGARVHLRKVDATKKHP